jgi:hypothetical protein
LLVAVVAVTPRIITAVVALAAAVKLVRGTGTGSAEAQGRRVALAITQVDRLAVAVAVLVAAVAVLIRPTGHTIYLAVVAVVASYQVVAEAAVARMVALAARQTTQVQTYMGLARTLRVLVAADMEPMAAVGQLVAELAAVTLVVQLLLALTPKELGLIGLALCGGLRK